MNSCLNRTYRLVWSEVHNAWVAVAETVRSRTKSSGRSARIKLAALVSGLMGSSVALAQLPTGGQIVGGAGTISSSGTTMTVTQTTDRMAANWQSFNIGKGNTVNFVQPNSNSVALNRVLGSDVSVIQGALNANGKLFLINPNGVLFTKDSHVNVGSLVASTLNITTENFMAGNYRFEGASSNAIINQGNITANGDGADGGTVALIAAKIVNQGAITAHKGNVLIGAGSRVTLNLGGPVSIEVEQGALDALIEQGGAIKADGGLVYLTAKAANDIVTTVINHTGITEAQTLATGESGQIYLMGDMTKGRVEVAGTLDASAPNGGNGGFIETSAAKVAFAADLNITTKAPTGKTGQWLIDPVDFTVAASGGDITGAALGTLLASNSVKIQTATGTDSATEQFGTSGTNGDIFVNDGVTWSSGNTLTLSAHRNIEINASVDASGGSGGKLALHYGQGALAASNTAKYTINAAVRLQSSGSDNGKNSAVATNFSSKLGSDGSVVNYTVITAANKLQSILVTDSNSRYALGADIDLSDVAWVPIGNSTNAFWGQLDGLGNTIRSLTLSGGSYLGLFANARNAIFRNLNLSNFSITSTALTNAAAVAGALTGRADGVDFYNIGLKSITISGGGATNPYGEGASGTQGGLVGWIGVTGASSANRLWRIRGSDIRILGRVELGGLVGLASLAAADSLSDIQLDNVTLTITGYDANPSAAGGLVGRLNADSSTAITGVGITGLSIVTKNNGSLSNGGVGGLVGVMNGSSVTYSYTRGSINTNSHNEGSLWKYGGIGGLVGTLYIGSISNSYSTVNITANGTQNQFEGVGGVLGHATGGSTKSITTSYAAGSINSGNMSGTSLNYFGGFIGRNGSGNALTISNSYWDTQTSGRASATGVTSQASTGITVSSMTGATSAEMKTAATFTGWDANTWQFQDPGQRVAGYGVGATYPFLKNVSTAAGILGDHSAIFAGGWGGLKSWQQTGADSSAYTVANAAQLQNINQVAVNKYSFVLSSDINLSSISNWVPIGDSTTRFNGSVDGAGFTVSNLVIDRPADDNVGLFGFTDGAIIRNFGVTTASVSGNNRVGVVVGLAARSTLENVYSTGSVTGAYTANFTQVGGLVGYLNDSSVSRSYSKASVTGAHGSVGGLVGYATGTNPGDAAITDSYATGTVTSTGNKEFVGGLVGGVNDTKITRSYAIGQVVSTALQRVGGLVGGDNGGTNSVVDSYWDTTTSGLTVSVGGTGKITAQMRAIATYSGWNIEDDQALDTSYLYPRLTMASGSPTWKIRLVAANNSGTNTTTDNSRQNAVKTVSTEASRVVTQNPMSSISRQESRLVTARAESPGPLNQQSSSIAQVGGLKLVQVDQDPSVTGATSAAGRDPSGFMQVFAVRGGIRVPQVAATQVCAAGAECK